MTWRRAVLLLLLAAVAAFSAPERGSRVAPPSRPVVGGVDEAAVTRPPVATLRTDLQTILARPEYQTRGDNWLWNLRLRALRWLLQWWQEHMAPYVANLYVARPALYWTIVGLTLLLLLAIGYHLYFSLRSAFGGARRKPARVAADIPAASSDPRDLLAQADEAAAQGHFPVAFRWLYLALIRQLDRRALLRYDAAATNTDYLRQVRDVPEVAAQLEPLTRAVEPVWYGYAAAGPDDYQRCREWVLAAWEEASHAPV